MDEDAKSSSSSNEWEKIDDSEQKSLAWNDLFGNGEFRRRVLFAPARATIEANNENEVKSRDKQPDNGDLVRIKVSGRVTQEHQSSSEVVDRFNEVEFVIGWHQVIEAWEMAVQLMFVGEIDEIQVHSRFAFGSEGLDPDVPSDACMTYKIELLHFEPGPNVREMDDEQKLNFMEDRKLRGNYHFSRKEHIRAVQCYKKALESTGIDDEFDTTDHFFDDIRIALYNNLAATYLKLEGWQEVLRYSDCCLKIDPQNAKSLYRRAKALQNLKDFEQALKVYEQLSNLGCAIKDLQQDISKCKEGVKSDRERMKKMYSKMVNGLSDSVTSTSSLFRQKTIRLACVALAAGAAIGASLAYRFLN